jgi:fructose-1,6-bisphosphatase/inositol monophosphatase family enzyme
VQQFKVSLYGGQTFKLFYDPQLTVQQVLQKVGAKLPDFDINKYVPKDLAGTELRLDEKLSEVKGHELTFKSLKIDSTPATPASGTTTTTGGKAIASVPPTNIPKKFTVFLSNDQRNTIIYKPELVLRDVLVKMCSNRGLQLNHWVPRDISGRLLDLNMTLGDIGSLEITFNTHPENRDVKVILPDSVTHTLRFNPDTTGAEVLMRACEHRGVPVWKFIAQTVEKQPIDLALPMSKLDIPNRQIIFQVPRAGKYWKDLAAGQAFLRKIVPEIREIVPKSGFGRGISNDLATQLRTLLHRAAAQLTTQFPGYEIITTNQSTVLADTLQHSDRPAWILSICGTENLLSGLPMAGTSLCLVESGRARAAVIHSLQDDTQYFAHEGEGAYANDSQVLFGSRCEDLGSAVISSHVDQVQSSSGALLSTHPTSASAPPRNPDEVPQLVTSKLATRLRRVIFRAAAARSFGAPDIECCLVARGVLDSVCILGANPNMLAAATLILHEARVSILDLDSAAVVDDCATINFWLSARHVICGGARLVDRISKILLPSATLASQNRTKKSGRGRAPSLSLLREDDDSGDSDAMSAVSGVTSHSDDEDEYLQSTSDVADSPHSQSFHEDRSEDQPGSFV